MPNNLMEQYVKNTRKFIENYSKLYLGDLYQKKISDEYIDVYIESRIHNYGESEQKFFYKRIYTSLENKKNELKQTFEKKDEHSILKNLQMYQSILYIDGVRPMLDLKEFIKITCQKRMLVYNLTKIPGLEPELFKLSKKYIDEKVSYLSKYESKDFELETTKYTLIDNTYKVYLNYNFRIPYIYSNKVIGEVYNEGIVNEDKLIIEYTLLTIKCIKEIDSGDFNTKYIVDFASSILTKQTKLKQTLRIIDNAAIQEKIYLKIDYKSFEENKEIIYELMQEGYRFAIIIDDTFKANSMNYKKLSMFYYIIVYENSKNYDNIKYNGDRLTSTVIYDK